MQSSKVKINVLRLRATELLLVLSTCILATVIIVNLAINRLEGNTIKLSSTISQLEPMCQRFHNKTSHGIKYFHEENDTTVDKHFPPVTNYGVLVWVDDEAIARTTHATIQQINQRLSAEVEVSNNNNISEALCASNDHKAKCTQKWKAKERRIIHRIVQWREEQLITMSDLTETLNKNTMSDLTETLNKNVSRVNHLRTLSEEGNALKEEMLRVAKSEQVGLPTFEHVFAPEPGTQMHLITISFFTVKTNANEFHHAYGDDKKANNVVDCYKFDDRQYICKYNKHEWEIKAATHKPMTFAFDTHKDGNSRSSEWAHAKGINGSITDVISNQEQLKLIEKKEIEEQQSSFAVRNNDNYNRLIAKTNVIRHVQDALSSIIAQELEIESFHAHHVKEWHTEREGHGCSYALNALKTLEISLHTHPNMIVPQSVQKTLVHVLQHNVHAAANGQTRSFVAIAQLAHALQFHLLLTPQLYIPWDHALVSQFTIIQPLIVIWLLCIRFMLAARKRLKLEQEQESLEEAQREQQEEKEGAATTANEIHESNEHNDITSPLCSSNNLETCNVDNHDCNTTNET